MLFFDNVKKSDSAWVDEADARGWILPAPNAAWRRLWGVRHIRYLIVVYRIERHYSFWEGLGSTRTGYDEWVAYAIWRGWW